MEGYLALLVMGVVAFVLGMLSARRERTDPPETEE